MRKRLIALLLLLAISLSISGCSNTPKESYFRITFIDVGQGDSALVECDGHFMLIDGGDTTAADAVERVLKDRMSKVNTTTLDVLVASHLDEDHIGGLVEGLDSVKKIKYTLSNSKSSDTKAFKNFQQRIQEIGSKIKVPKVNATYNLGSAEVKVVDVRNEKNNDSLVLLITYGKTTFLFAGDMEQNQESRICDRYGDDDVWNISLLKVAHHGSKSSTSIRFLRMLMPQYAVISVGKNNKHDHPHEDTLGAIEQAMTVRNLDPSEHLFRTDINGNITVTSDGTTLTINTEKGN